MLFERLQFAEIKNNRNLRFVISFFLLVLVFIRAI